MNTTHNSETLATQDLALSPTAQASTSTQAPRELSPAELLAVAGGLEIVPMIQNDPQG